MPQKNNPVVLIIFVSIMLLISFLCFRSAIKSRKKAKEKAEHEALLKSEAEKARKAAIAEQLKKEREKEEKRLELEYARDEYRSDYKIYSIGKGSPWTDAALDDPDDNSRIERAYQQRNQIKLLTYDTRYHIGKIKGTSGCDYLTSASFCTCEDFHRRLSPCKHMFFLAHTMLTEGEDKFIELDYEKGLFGITGFIFGKFADGKDAVIRNLQERGLITLEEQNKECRIAVAGKTTAVKKMEKLALAGIPVFQYADALKIFTSEIRHPELE